SYYPFGMNQEGTFMNDAAAKDTKYQYNAKELNDDFGLNWNDYGARWYDAAIGRWNGVDPLAEKMQSWSPYHFAFVNPLRFMDPDGMAPDDIVYFNMNGEEIYRKESDTEFRTFVAKSSTTDDNYLRTDANLHSASSGLLGGTAFDEATMPGVITQEMSGHKPEQSKYQYLDYQIAAETHIFNKELASGNLNFDQQSYEIGERATPLDVNLVKSLAYKESGLGLGASISTEAHDVLSMYNPGDNSGKNLIGMTAQEISTGGSSKSSLHYGIRWLHFKGYRSDDGVSKNFKGWDSAVHRFGPGDAKEPGYANKVKSIRNSIRPATAKDY
ncbi:MAG TPA: RHS repeat-associated core domain-containing protein, partial [Haliscomenobacter sp.]|uniref:RHS repeat domain-containing protein n=1 Tax=Haliscomenobacter sp. TaxID=2717303 RepID=UPI002BC25200